jgi:hypothetical protein
MLNKEIYVKPPQENRLVNNGVAEVSEDHSKAALEILKTELESFVCDGQYEKGIETILEKFLMNLDSNTEQPGVWISGFYGSGKSHLAKMLRTLWTDFLFPDNSSARNIAKIPEGIRAHLKELSNKGKKFGGLHAAAGKLGAGAGDKVRLALLGIIFRSSGLPEQYNQAMFTLWLKEEKILEAVKTELRTNGKDFNQELPHMYVSGHLAKALLKVRPDLGSSEADVRQTLRNQFPQVQDISSQELVMAIERALSVDEKFPLTLVVLDEVQQFIGADPDKAFQIQEVTETLSKHFNGKLIFVGTGQSALSGMPNLQKLMGRFPVQLVLGDWDVENVTRQIILAKKPTAIPGVEKVWRDNLGEISRHLRGTKLEHITDDENYLTSDYPLLPVRRRFWEKIMRTIDVTGTVSQLRSQLRVVHEAALATADSQLGHVVSGDFLYDQIAANLVSTAQLPKEVYENVQKFSSGDEKSKLKSQLLKLIFLINKLPVETAFDLGLKATNDTLADLLVTDLAQGSAGLRKEIPSLLDELQNKDRLVMSLAGESGPEYRLQTRESSAWYEEYRAQESDLKAAAQRVEQKRSELFKSKFAEVMKKVRIVQGRDNLERKLNITYDDVLPRDNDKALYLWIQDGWQTEEKSVIAEARSKATDNPTLFLFLPAQQKTELNNALVSFEAAKNTIQRKGSPSTEEGRDAQRSMESRQTTAEADIQRLLSKLFSDARLFQAGGQEVTETNELFDKINKAGKASVIRLYSQFDVADSDQWGKVYDEAKKGNLEALKAVGHTHEADKQPVCQKILAYVGPGKTGADIRNSFESPPYGWSKDTIDGALMALLGSGHLKALDSANKAFDVKAIDRGKINQTNFQRESITITPPQLIKIRQLFSAVGVPCQPKEELIKVPQLLFKLREQANKAGGQAPAPDMPNTKAIDSVEEQTGNAQLLELFNSNDVLLALSSEWVKIGAHIEKKLPIWGQLSDLLRHAKSLGPYQDLNAEMEAIIVQRSLLSEPDPVYPLLTKLVDLLRSSISSKIKNYEDTFKKEFGLLELDLDWKKITLDQKEKLISEHHLTAIPKIEVKSAEEIQDALDECDIDHWVSRTQALPSRFNAARYAASQLLKPNLVSVSIPKRTINNEDELTQWVDEVEKLIKEHLKNGPVAL